MPKHQGARLSASFRAALLVGALLTPIGFSALAADGMTLRDALVRAAAADPATAAGQARVAAAEASMRQAAVGPNPTVGFDIENFAGTGRIGALDQTEATAWYQQTYERGGKREARVGVARAGISMARERADVRGLDTLSQVQAAWVEAQAAEAMVPIAEDRLALAISLERDVARRVSAARDPLFAGERARTAVAQARIGLDQARDTARNTRAALAAYWGGSADDVMLDQSAFLDFRLTSPPPLGDDVPDLRLLAFERDGAAARVALERSQAVQDPTFRAGVRHFREGDEVALIIGGSIPLGRNDARKGAVEQAQAERLAADSDLSALRIDREREIARLTARRASAASEIGRIDREVLPSAERAVRLVRDGFNRGGGAFTYMEVADAERAVLDARARRIELLRSFHIDGVRIDRLLAVHLPLIASLEAR